MPSSEIIIVSISIQFFEQIDTVINTSYTVGKNRNDPFTNKNLIHRLCEVSVGRTEASLSSGAIPSIETLTLKVLSYLSSETNK